MSFFLEKISQFNECASQDSFNACEEKVFDLIKFTKQTFTTTDIAIYNSTIEIDFFEFLKRLAKLYIYTKKSSCGLWLDIRETVRYEAGQTLLALRSVIGRAHQEQLTPTLCKIVTPEQFDTLLSKYIVTDLLSDLDQIYGIIVVITADLINQASAAKSDLFCHSGELEKLMKQVIVFLFTSEFLFSILQNFDDLKKSFQNLKIEIIDFINQVFINILQEQPQNRITSKLNSTVEDIEILISLTKEIIPPGYSVDLLSIIVCKDIFELLESFKQFKKDFSEKNSLKNSRASNVRNLEIQALFHDTFRLLLEKQGECDLIFI